MSICLFIAAKIYIYAVFETFPSFYGTVKLLLGAFVKSNLGYIVHELLQCTSKNNGTDASWILFHVPISTRTETLKITYIAHFIWYGWLLAMPYNSFGTTMPLFDVNVAGYFQALVSSARWVMKSNSMKQAFSYIIPTCERRTGFRLKCNVAESLRLPFGLILRL